jgi:EAL domain-containing protein (putative c-di-GMP-specific phosphodiesterase class I)
MAKSRGRNQVQIYSECNMDLARHRGELSWINRLQDALQNNRFELYAQRIAPVQPKHAAGGVHFELLLRLADGSGASLSPGAFMPAAERYQLAVRIDRWVIDQVFALLSEQTPKLTALALCSINLSGQSVSDAQFQTYLLKRLDTLGGLCEKICVEITETAAVTHLTEVARVIKTLKTRGCRFALDDFGSGLSSFAYLKNLPVDFLKIDGVFVKDIAADPIDLAMVRSINEIAQLLGKRTIAEYVENDAILQRLRELGIDYAQGYGIARPQPLQQLLSAELGKP